MAKKYVETYSSSNAAALYPEERVTKINLVTLLVTQKISQRGVKQITLNKKKKRKKKVIKPKSDRRRMT